MNYNGEIVFIITDPNYINVNFGLDFPNAKIVNKGDVIALGRKATHNKWLYKVKFSDGNDYLIKLADLTEQLYEKSEYITQILHEYEEVSVNIYIRSDLAEIGYSLPNNILKKLASLGCNVNFEIFSFGMAVSGESDVSI